MWQREYTVKKRDRVQKGHVLVLLYWSLILNYIIYRSTYTQIWFFYHLSIWCCYIGICLCTHVECSEQRSPQNQATKRTDVQTDSNIFGSNTYAMTLTKHFRFYFLEKIHFMNAMFYQQIWKWCNQYI